MSLCPDPFIKMYVYLKVLTPGSFNPRDDDIVENFRWTFTCVGNRMVMTSKYEDSWFDSLPYAKKIMELKWRTFLKEKEKRPVDCTVILMNNLDVVR